MADNTPAPSVANNPDETSLSEELQLFRDLTERNALAVIVTDTHGRIKYSNWMAKVLSGYTLDEIKNKVADFLLADQPSKNERIEFLNALRGGRPRAARVRLQRRDGTTFWADVQVVPIADAQSRMAHYCIYFQDITAQKLAAEKMEHLASFDQLTALPNRSRFLNDLRRLIEQATTNNETLLMMYLDIDEMKALNQKLGQVMADQVLITIAHRLREASRRQDLLTRLGGDEFAIVLAGGERSENLHEAAERLLKNVGQSLSIDDQLINFSLSTGTALFPDDGKDADTLIGCAEIALLAAKNEGGGAIRHFDVSLGNAERNRSEAIETLREAIRNNELVLHYQPQVSLHSGQIVGLEALVRWQHPTKGLIFPNEFIPLAEETGLIIGLDNWVLRATLEQMRRWQDLGIKEIRIAINLSPRHFRQNDLPETIDALLRENNISPLLLDLELTEGVMMHDTTTTIRILDRIKDIGVRLSLDDFGTGYSSLAYLSRFPIDMIKIDKSFVSDITSNPTNAAISSATIAMAHKLDKRVIAEGVENEGQMRFLRSQDCDEMQGFYFSKGVATEEIETMLRSGTCMNFEQTSDDSVQTLLLVDDEANILNALKRLLRREGYRILCAESAAIGFDLLSTNSVQVIVSDHRMPEMTGAEFLSKAKDLYPQTVRLVLSGYSDLATVTDAINRGAIYRYLSKPWDDENLKQEIRDAFRHQREKSRANDNTPET